VFNVGADGVARPAMRLAAHSSGTLILNRFPHGSWLEASPTGVKQAGWCTPLCWAVGAASPKVGKWERLLRIRSDCREGELARRVAPGAAADPGVS